MVVVPMAVIVVLAGVPGPVMVWPTDRPVVLETAVIVGLPLVVLPVKDSPVPLLMAEIGLENAFAALVKVMAAVPASNSEVGLPVMAPLCVIAPPEWIVRVPVTLLAAKSNGVE